MEALQFRQRAETFGFDTPTPWALDAFRLLFHVPRAYEPLVDAWCERHEGARKSLERLHEMEFIAYQQPLIYDIRTMTQVRSPSKPVTRYKASRNGRRLAEEAAEDQRIFDRLYPRARPDNAVRALDLLMHAAADTSSRFGLSASHLIAKVGIAERSGRWWVKRLLADGYLEVLPERARDARTVIPGHYRVTPALCRQLSDVLDAYGGSWGALRAQFRLKRSRFLADINLGANISMAGATDFDHDVNTQEILAATLKSPLLIEDGRFEVEPRFTIKADTSVKPWRFDARGDHTVFYQPDAMLVERDGTRTRRAFIEYERSQTRKDAWSHIERFIGHVVATTLPFEPVVLRFVVDTESKVNGYVELLSAFADYGLEHPERMAPNPTTLAATSRERLAAHADVLAPEPWFRVPLPRADPERHSVQPVLHRIEDSPYRDYFTGPTSEEATPA